VSPVKYELGSYIPEDDILQECSMFTPKASERTAGGEVVQEVKEICE
jgi:hypothetical protein